MLELPAAHAAGLAGLFTTPALALLLDAVAAGNSPARIWTEDTQSPQSAFLYDGAHVFVLAGAAGNDGFNQAVQVLLAEQLLPRARDANLGLIKVYTASGDWAAPAGAIFNGIALQPRQRVIFAYRQDAASVPAARLPDGYHLRPIDAALLAETGLHNLDALTAEIESCWPSLARFIDHGLGRCVVARSAVAAWCTAEYVSAKKCGLGVETVAAYQRRGLATAAASAAVRACLTRGLTPHWDSWQSNAPSLAVARRVGFEGGEGYEVRGNW